MGPQLYRCGNAQLRSHQSYRATRFNGAATLSLRKSFFGVVDPSFQVGLQCGRNFIVAEMSDPHHEQAHPAYASMGPQLYRCGNADARDIIKKYYLLQWGRNFIVAETSTQAGGTGTSSRFNGAATLSLRKLMPTGINWTDETWLQWGRNFIVAETAASKFKDYAITKLQWGRNFIVAETCLVDVHIEYAANASMGPQLYRYGNKTPMDRGTYGLMWLQWGRNFIVAEI